MFDQLLSEVFRLFGYIKNGNVAEKIKTLLGSLRITDAAFGDYSLRDEQQKEGQVLDLGILRILLTVE